MIIVPKKNLYLPERIWGRPKFQRGIVCATAVYGPVIPALSVSLSNTNNQNSRFGTCWAGVQYNTSGSEWGSTNVGNYTVARGPWLDVGDVADVWLICTVNSGSLDTNELSTRQQMSATKKIEMIEGDYDTEQNANVTVEAYDAASGGTLLDDATFNISAFNEEEPP